MLKKLMDGGLSLTDTFWKFGVLGLILAVFIIRFFGSMLAQRLMGVSIWQYFTVYFNPLNMNTAILTLTVCYLGCLSAFIWYSIVIILGTWRSSAEYSKSIWLRHVSRVVMFLMVLICYNIIF